MIPLAVAGKVVKTTFSAPAEPRSVSVPLRVRVALAERASEPKVKVAAWPPPLTATIAAPELTVRAPVLTAEAVAPVRLARSSVPLATVKAVFAPKGLPVAVARPSSVPAATVTAPVKALPADGARITVPEPTLVRPPAPEAAPEKVTSPPTSAVMLIPRVSVSAPEKSFAPASRPPRVWVLPVAVFSNARPIVRTPEARTWEKEAPRNWTAALPPPKATSWPATT